MAATAAILKICDGPILNFFWTAFGYMCTKFHAFITKCTIVWNFAVKLPHYIKKSLMTVLKVARIR